MSPAPSLAVIFLPPIDFAHIQKTIRHLRAQTRAAEIELVIATPDRALLEEEARAWREFHSKCARRRGSWRLMNESDVGMYKTRGQEFGC